MRLLLEVRIILYQIHSNSNQNRKTCCYKWHGLGCPWVKMIYRKSPKDRKAKKDKQDKQINRYKMHKKDKKDKKDKNAPKKTSR